VRPVLRIAEAREGHLGARSEGAWAGQPLAEIVPVPAAAFLRQRIGERKALALADRFPEHVPEVRAELVRAALVGIVAGHALVEDLLAGRGIGLGEIDFDRLLGCCRTLALLLGASDRVTHLICTPAWELSPRA